MMTLKPLRNHHLHRMLFNQATGTDCREYKRGCTKTLVTLHQQGEQITRSHRVAVDIDHDLSRGKSSWEALVASKTWKRKKALAITGPVTVGVPTSLYLKSRCCSLLHVVVLSASQELYIELMGNKDCF
ncbi:hypothetical protein VIGAN_01304900 [Vigna angularis var. angularis]|uniref:Uncharacterized protein n=1 Tax=Vigna angularis var. angularis TaxID=157739 RepID=A0A0S3R3S2_PHAAN|nr:hypothetical protein VIGAN_01304900 [Vigna angularis var. angularis]